MGVISVTDEQDGQGGKDAASRASAQARAFAGSLNHKTIHIEGIKVDVVAPSVLGVFSRNERGGTKPPN